MSVLRHTTPFVMLLAFAACDPRSPRSEAQDTLSSRLGAFEEDCGFAVIIPTSVDRLRQTFAEARAHTYEVTTPLDGTSGDNVFPMTRTPEFNHQAVTGAIVVICPGEDARILGARSPRFAFYFDESGTVFHVEEHSLYTG